MPYLHSGDAGSICILHMENKSADMQAIFSKLSEKNEDILILVAKSIKVAQETDNRKCKPMNY